MQELRAPGASQASGKFNVTSRRTFDWMQESHDVKVTTV